MLEGFGDRSSEGLYGNLLLFNRGTDWDSQEIKLGGTLSNSDDFPPAKANREMSS
jgi:hypothetical protein